MSTRGHNLEHVADFVIVKKGNSCPEDERRALEGENLRRALKKRDLDGGVPRLDWKKRETRNAGDVGELEGVFK
ncbi:hypothetical protein TNCV_1389431 [Trichonephila clavipes]|nr:hypothetical protein TNCV_1389431 [Trichonephila clavipes]